VRAMTTAGVAVVGLGVGRAHLWAWKRLPEHFRVTAVCDHDADRRAATAERFPDAFAAADLDEPLGRDDVDIVDLCTPPALHLDQITRVLRAGKDVVCEKPVVATPAEVDQLLAVEAETGRRVMPIFQYRYGHGLQKLRHLVEAGVTGRLHTATVEVSWLRGQGYYAAPWRGTFAGELGGVLLTHAVHALDMLTHGTGLDAVAVSARTATRVNDVETEDCAAATIELEGGALATLSATLGSLVEITRHRLCFERLTAESGTEPYTNSSEPWTFTADGSFDVDAALQDFAPRHENFLGQFERYAEGASCR